VDPEGLLRTLRQRVFELNECLNCGKIKANTFAVQTHMRDKGHCQIPYTTEEEQLEIGEFYDFRSTYSDDYSDSEDESMEDADDVKKPSGAKLGAKRTPKSDGADDKEDDGWETDSSASSLDSDDLHAVPAENHYHQYERLSKHPHHSRDDQRAHHQRDGWHAHKHKPAHAVFYDDYELHLPSGKSVGHRSLNRYFRQNLHSHPSPEERAERLAIEAAQDEDGMELDSDGEERFPGRRHDPTHGRALVNRETRGLGLQGVTDANMAEVKRTLVKGRKKEVAGQKAKDLEVSKIFFKQRHRNPVSYLR
jgi:pre-60S factor REI1